MVRSKFGLVLGILLSVKLFALETVNLIKAHGFEHNVDAWTAEVGTTNPGYSEAEAELQDSDIIYEGSYSAMSNTINRPENVPPDTRDTAIFYQDFVVPKQLQDFDSLYFLYFDSCDIDSVRHACFSFDLMTELGPGTYLTLRYHFYNDDPFVTPSEVGGRKIFPIQVTLNEWTEFSADIYEDFVNKKAVAPTQEIERVVLRNFGMQIESGQYYGWWGQKVYWDDIRLMGYADYDVGVKEIISESSLTIDSAYVPMARIKNFGRENADSFLVIAVIEDSTFIAYIDTLPWSLPADTEDTVSFAEFVPDHQAEYVLHVYTVMTPDESDADDRLSLNLFCSVCQDSPEFPGISMDLVNSVTKGALRVSYALPASQPGIISVYDAAGRIQDRMNVRGVSEVTITADLTPGVYFIRLDAGEESVTHKAVLLL